MKNINKKTKCLGFLDDNENAVSIYSKHFRHKFLGNPRLIDLSTLEKPDLLFIGRPYRKKWEKAGAIDGINCKDIDHFAFASLAVAILQPKHYIVLGPKHYSMEKNMLLSTYLPNSQLVSVLTDTVSPLKQSRLIWTNMDLSEPEQEEGHVIRRGQIPAHNWSKTRSKEGHRRKLPEKHILERVAINGLVNHIDPTISSSNAVTFFPDEKIDILKLDYPQRVIKSLKESFFHKIKREWLITATEAERVMGFPEGWTSGLSERDKLNHIGNSTPVRVWENIIKPHI